MRLVLGSDHAGYELKQRLAALKTLGGQTLEWQDVGTFSADSVDYPDYAAKACQQILAQNSREELLKPCGVLICGSGVGVSIAANRVPQIRAVLALSSEVAVLSRRHNASNVLCLGARFTSFDESIKILEQWLKTDFEGGRHQTRIEGIEKVRGS